MSPIKIFLASSAELSEDRQAFENFIYRKSKMWQDQRNTSLKLILWEDFIDAMSPTGLQDEYNKAIEDSNIFVMLFWTKVGKYTDEEFETAWKHFKATNQPWIYTYFKDFPSTEPKQESLEAFRNKLKDLKHYETVYKNTEGLLLHFSIQLDKLYTLNTPSTIVEKARLQINKAEIFDLINKTKLYEAIEELNKFFLHENDSLNALEDEFINQPNNYSQPQFAAKLRAFTNKYS